MDKVVKLKDSVRDAHIAENLNVDTLGMIATALRGIGHRAELVMSRAPLTPEDKELLRLSVNVTRGLYSHILTTMNYAGNPYDTRNVEKYNQLLARFMSYYEHFFGNKLEKS